MSKFTKSITRTYQFEGDTVVVVMDRLKRKHALKLIPYMSEPDEDGKVIMKLDESMDFMDVASDILAKHVTSITGLLDGNGEIVPINAVIGEDGTSYFIELSTEIMADLMEASFMKQKDEKKSEKLLKGISVDSNTIENQALT